MTSIICISMLGFAILFKTFYKKAKSGEVIVLNALESKPKVIRGGALVLPVVHRSTILDLNTRLIQLEQNSIDKIKALYDFDLTSFAIQIENSDAAILTAYERINVSADSMEKLKSVLEHSLQECFLSAKGYDELKNHLSQSLKKVGYELVV